MLIKLPPQVDESQSVGAYTSAFMSTLGVQSSASQRGGHSHNSLGKRKAVGGAKKTNAGIGSRFSFPVK